jgi:hypothetical protein
MSNKYLLVISKNYIDTSEQTALTFSTTFSELLHIPSRQITHLIGDEVQLSTVKNTIYNFVYDSLADHNYNPILYIYMNGHGNQMIDANGDEITDELNETNEELNEIEPTHKLNYFVDNELTDIINSAVFYSNSVERPLIVLISDHCSCSSILNKLQVNYFDWISIGTYIDTEDKYTINDLMTINLLNMLKENKDDLQSLTTLSFYKLLDTEMIASFTGKLQYATLHISSKSLLRRQLFY